MLYREELHSQHPFQNAQFAREQHVVMSFSELKLSPRVKVSFSKVSSENDAIWATFRANIKERSANGSLREEDGIGRSIGN